MKKAELREHLAETFAEATLNAGKRRALGRCPSEGGEPYEAILDEETGELTLLELSRYHRIPQSVEWVPGDIVWHPVQWPQP
jgi:hypothetical protein